MKFLKLLEKENGQDYRKNDKTKQIQKTIISSFQAFKIPIKIENELQYFNALITYQGLLNKQALEQCFEDTRRELYEIWDDISYQERSRLLYTRAVDVMNDLPYIKKDTHVIFIPFFDQLLNALYHKELAILELPQYFKLYKQFETRMESLNNYGLDIYDEGFIPIKNIIVQDDVRIFYYHPLKSLYKINQQYELTRYPLNKLACQAIPHTKDLFALAESLHNSTEIQLIEAFLGSNLIGDKSKKALQKYLKGLNK